MKQQVSEYSNSGYSFALLEKVLHEESNYSYQFEHWVDEVPNLPFTTSGKHSSGRRIRSRELVVLQRSVQIESQEMDRKTWAVCKPELAYRIWCKRLTKPSDYLPTLCSWSLRNTPKDRIRQTKEVCNTYESSGGEAGLQPQHQTSVTEEPETMSIDRVWMRTYEHPGEWLERSQAETLNLSSESSIVCTRPSEETR